MTYAFLLLSAFLVAGCAPPPADPPPAPPAQAAAPSAPPPAAGVAWDKVAPAEGAEVATTSAAQIPAWRNAAGAVACPVMGMGIASPDDAVSFADHDGVRYYFCCDSCEKLFLDNPTAYANGKYVREHSLDPTAPKSCDDPPVAG
jgi:YHS domain-containing protein